ncbi:MAG: hypothetical protein J6T86_04885 [Bacteroidales bacterium]|nr:hypothetical protein [Bacteroidales bacterium]
MIYFELNELNRDNLYRKSQSMIEYLCDKYAVGEQRGVIEMANQNIIEHILSDPADFTIDLNAHVENNELVFAYSADQPVFRFLENLTPKLQEDNVWCVLIDDYTLSDDLQSLTISFYVKPHQTVSKRTFQEVMQTKESYL